MLSIRDLSPQEAAALYTQLADLVETVSQFTPTKSVTGVVHHGQNLLTALENHLSVVDPLPRRAPRSARKSQPVEVK